MKDWSCGLSVKRQATMARRWRAANSCQKGSSAIGRPSPFDPGTSTSTAWTVLVDDGYQRRNSALSKLAPGSMAMSIVAPAAAWVVAAAEAPAAAWPSAAASISAMIIAPILPGYERDAVAFSFISFAARKIEHHSLCSAIGIPHSTQTRTRCFGGSLLPKRRFRNDMRPPTERARDRRE